MSARRKASRGKSRSVADVLRHSEPVDSDALDDLTMIVRWREQLEQQQALTVDLARAQGATWAAIGAALGITQQAANKRYGRALV